MLNWVKAWVSAALGEDVAVVEVASVVELVAL
jgi:hypothetical protein